MGYYEDLFARYGVGVVVVQQGPEEQGPEEPEQDEPVTRQDLEIAAFLEGARPRVVKDERGNTRTQWFLPDGTPVSIDYVEEGGPYSDTTSPGSTSADTSDPYLMSLSAYLEGPLYDGPQPAKKGPVSRPLSGQLSETQLSTIERAPEMGNVPIIIDESEGSIEEETQPPKSDAVIENAPEMGNVPVDDAVVDSTVDSEETTETSLSRLGRDLKLGLEETVKLPIRAGAYLSSGGWEAAKLLPAALRAMAPEGSAAKQKAQEALDWIKRQQQVVDEIYEGYKTEATDKPWDLAKSAVWGGLGSIASQAVTGALSPPVAMGLAASQGLRYLPKAVDVATAMFGDKLVVNPISRGFEDVINSMDISEENKNLVRALIDLGAGILSNVTLENALTRIAERPDRYLGGLGEALESLLGRSPKAKAKAAFDNMIGRMIAGELISLEEGERLRESILTGGLDRYAERIRKGQGPVASERPEGGTGETPRGENPEQSAAGEPPAGYEEGTRHAGEAWKNEVDLKGDAVSNEQEPIMGGLEQVAAGREEAPQVVSSGPIEPPQPEPRPSEPFDVESLGGGGGIPIDRGPYARETKPAGNEGTEDAIKPVQHGVDEAPVARELEAAVKSADGPPAVDSVSKVGVEPVSSRPVPPPPPPPPDASLDAEILSEGLAQPPTRVSSPAKRIPEAEIGEALVGGKNLVTSHPMATLGAVAGVEVDDDGNVTINPERLVLGVAAGAGVGVGLAKREALREIYLKGVGRWDKHIAEPILTAIHRIVDHSITNEYLRYWLGIGYDRRVRALKHAYNIRAADILERALEVGRELLEIAPSKLEQKRLFQVMEGGISVDPIFERKALRVKRLFDDLRERAKELEIFHWTQFDKLTRREVNRLRAFMREAGKADTPGALIRFALAHDIEIPGKIPLGAIKSRLKANNIPFNPDADVGEIYDIAWSHKLHEHTKFGDNHIERLRDNIWEAQREAAIRLWHYDHTYKAGHHYMPHLYELHEGISPRVRRTLERELGEIHAQMVRTEPDTPERHALEDQYYTLRDILDRGVRRKDGDLAINPLKMSLGWAKARMTLPPEVQRLLGPIEEAAYSTSVGLGRQGTDLIRAEFLEAIASNPEWVRDPDKTLLLGNGWKVVRGRQWGPLNGKAVRRTVLADMEDIIEHRSVIVKLHDNLLARWKFGKTVIDPKVWARNIRSNIMLAWWADLAPWDIQTYKRAYDEFRSKGDLYQLAKREGLFSNSFVAGEIKRLRDDFHELKTAKDMRYWLRKAFAVPSERYQDIEHYFKLAVFIRHLKDGRSASEAAEIAEKALFNYLDIPPMIRQAKRLIPFITWTYKALPRTAEIALRRPWKVALMAGVAYGLEMATAQKLGMTWEELQAKRDNMEPWRRKRILGLFPAFVFVPFEDQWGNMLMMDLTFEMAFGSAGEQWGQSRLPFRDIWISNPLFDVISALYTNTDPFTGKPLSDPIMDDIVDYVEKVFTYAWRQFMPALTPGGTSWNKLAVGIKNYFEKDEEPVKDFAGRPRSLTTAILDTILGVKLSPADEQEVKRRKKALWERAKLSYRETIAKRRADVARGLLKEDEFYEAAKEYKKRLLGIARELRFLGPEFESETTDEND